MPTHSTHVTHIQRCHCTNVPRSLRASLFLVHTHTQRHSDMHRQGYRHHTPSQTASPGTCRHTIPETTQQAHMPRHTTAAATEAFTPSETRPSPKQARQSSGDNESKVQAEAPAQNVYFSFALQRQLASHNHIRLLRPAASRPPAIGPQRQPPPGCPRHRSHSARCGGFGCRWSLVGLWAHAPGWSCRWMWCTRPPASV